MDKKLMVRFVSYWIVNVVILALVNTLFPGSFELGNAGLSIPAAGIFSGLLLTVLLAVARGLARSRNFLVKGRIFMFIYYWGAASFAIWLIARVASVSGFGIASFKWAIGLGFAVSLVHWTVRQALKGMKLVEG